MKISNTGYWEEICSHHTDPGLQHALVDVLQDMQSIVDFGCGDASYIRYLNQRLNIETKAFDGNPNVKKITNGVGEQQDLAVPFELSRKFDVVMSLEVAEHIPKQFEHVYIDNLIRHTNKYVIISWAVPGQGGKGHVNEQPNQYVIDLFERLNFMYLQELSYTLRNCITDCNWFKNTLFIFEKNEN
jgi:hypothetical protein